MIPGVCWNANGIHFMDVARWREAQTNNCRPLHVHMQRHTRLLDPAATSSGRACIFINQPTLLHPTSRHHNLIWCRLFVQEFLGSGADFPVGNLSFFLFFSGHVGGSMIASLDMRRTGRYKMARTFDALNVLQSLRLLATRGHYTIDLAAGLGAGFLFDTFAGQYIEFKNRNGVSKLKKDGGATCGSCRRWLFL